MSEERYGPADRMLSLVFALQSSRVGLGIEELKERFGVERRAIERMLGTLKQRRDVTLIALPGDDGRKLWRIDGRAAPPLRLAVTAPEVAALDAAARALRRPAQADQRQALMALADKLRPLLAGVNPMGAERNAQDLAEMEDYALRPGPRERLAPGVLETLREATINREKVRIDLTYRGSGKRGFVTVHPYGFLHGAETYLVAYSENERAQAVRMFALDSLEKATPLGEAFVRPKRWSLEKFAAQSFGLWREKPSAVEWRFAPKAADRAARWVFHPTQKLTRNKDGSLTVRFRTGGLLEMAWHLQLWGDAVTVVRPAKLRRMAYDEQGKVRIGPA